MCALYQSVLLGSIVHPQKSEAYMVKHILIMMLQTVTLCWFVVAVASSPSSSKSNEDFDVNIVEQGTHFTEKVEVDAARNVEQIQVPPHNDIMGAKYIHYFNRNLTLKLTTGSEHCFLQDQSRATQDGYAEQHRELLGALRHARDYPPENGVTLVVNHWAIGDRVREEDFSLSPEMRRLCLGRAIYWLQRMDDSVSVGSHPHNASHLIRHRRQYMSSQVDWYRCKFKFIGSGYVCYFYESCSLEGLDRFLRRAPCRNKRASYIAQMQCCRECIPHYGDDFFPFCDALNDFTCVWE